MPLRPWRLDGPIRPDCRAAAPSRTARNGPCFPRFPDRNKSKSSQDMIPSSAPTRSRHRRDDEAPSPRGRRPGEQQHDAYSVKVPLRPRVEVVQVPETGDREFTVKVMVPAAGKPATLALTRLNVSHTPVAEGDATLAVL